MAKNNKIPIATPKDTAAYVLMEGTPEDMRAANLEYGKAMANTHPVVRSTAGFGERAGPGDITARNGLSKFDYELFRPGERVPVRYLGILEACMTAYERIGIIKNVIDLMGDFVSQGIKIVHPHPQVELFYQQWFKHINGPEISERFANLFYRTGNPIIRRDMGKISETVVDDMKSGFSVGLFGNPFGLPDPSLFNDLHFTDFDFIQPTIPKPKKSIIPLKYHFLNPLFMVLIGGNLAMFAGVKRYGLRIPGDLATLIKSPRNADEVLMVSGIPDYITGPVIQGSNIIPLDPDRVSVYHYKKDSWQEWAYPMIYCIMDELILLQKLKMADLSALDGAISHIRIWKLGNIEAKIWPTDELVERLNNCLQHAGNGQAFDLIWGPDITVEETNSDISTFLGMEKYIPTLNNIYAGLGIPPTLTGNGGAEGGFTNNFLSLKTLIERLNYGRDMLRRFWNNEIKIVQQAMGFRFPAQIEFKNMVLTDEQTQTKLLMDLLDRDVVSLDRIREHFGYIPEVEESAIKRDYKGRESGKIPPKVSPFHDANQDISLEKIFAQTGVVTPSELGIKLQPRSPGEETSLDLQNKQHALQQDQVEHTKKMDKVTTKQNHVVNLQKQKDDTSIKKLQIKHGILPGGESGEGRPQGANDQTKRKQKRVLPRTKASSDVIALQLWAKDAQEAIASIINPVFLKQCNKKNMRSLTTAETEQIEHLKWALLCNIEPDLSSMVNEKTIATLLQEPLAAHPEADGYWKYCVADFISRKGVEPTVEEIKQIQNYVFAIYKGDFNGENNN
jgi:hypothetical protein